MNKIWYKWRPLCKVWELKFDVVCKLRCERTFCCSAAKIRLSQTEVVTPDRKWILVAVLRCSESLDRVLVARIQGLTTDRVHEDLVDVALLVIEILGGFALLIVATPMVAVVAGCCCCSLGCCWTPIVVAFVVVIVAFFIAAFLVAVAVVLIVVDSCDCYCITWCFTGCIERLQRCRTFAQYGCSTEDRCFSITLQYASQYAVQLHSVYVIKFSVCIPIFTHVWFQYDLTFSTHSVQIH